MESQKPDAMAAIAEELRALGNEIRTLAAVSRHAGPADPKVLDDVLDWLESDYCWHTSSGVAYGIKAPHKEVIGALRELVITSQIETRAQGAATVYRVLLDHETTILSMLRVADVHSGFLRERLAIPAEQFDEAVRSLVARGLARFADPYYRLVDPLPLE